MIKLFLCSTPWEYIGKSVNIIREDITRNKEQQIIYTYFESGTEGRLIEKFDGFIDRGKLQT